MKIFDFRCQASRSARNSIFDCALPRGTECSAGAAAPNPKSRIQNPKFPPLLAALSLLAAPLPAAVPLANLIDDSHSLVIVAHDVPALIDRVQTSPWAATWNDDHVKKFLAPLREKIRFGEWDTLVKTNTGLTLSALQSLIEGDLLIALPAFDTLDRLAGECANEAAPPNPKSKIENPKFPALLLAADLAADAAEKIQTLLDFLAAAAKNSPGVPLYEPANGLTAETYAGVTLRTLTLPQILNPKSQIPHLPSAPIHWAISENTLIASPHRDLLLRAIDAQQRGGAEHALGKTKHYLAALNRNAAAPAIFVSLNFQAGLLAAIEKTWNPAAATTTATTALPPGLDALNEITCTLSLTPGSPGVSGSTSSPAAPGSPAASGSTRIETTITYAEKRGILNLLAFDNTPLQLPAYASADWPVFFTGNYDIPAGFAALEEYFAAANPRLHASWQARIDYIAANYNLNIKRDLIGSIGGQILGATVIPPGVAPDAPNTTAQAGSLCIIELKDPRTFQNTLAGLILAAGLDNAPIFSKRDYLGATIYALDNPRRPLSLAIAKNQLILTSGATSITESAVQNITNGPARPVTSDTAIRTLFDAAPPDIRYFATHDMRFTLRLIATALPRLPQTRALVAPDALPPPSTYEKYWNNLHLWLIEKSDALHIITEIPHEK